jgi:hypothetical protein
MGEFIEILTVSGDVIEVTFDDAGTLTVAMVDDYGSVDGISMLFKLDIQESAKLGFFLANTHLQALTRYVAQKMALETDAAFMQMGGEADG